MSGRRKANQKDLGNAQQERKFFENVMNRTLDHLVELQNGDPDEIDNNEEINVTADELERNLSEYRRLSVRIGQLLYEENDQDEIENEIEQSQSTIRKMQQAINTNRRRPETNIVHGRIETKHSTKLPDIKLTIFSGSSLEWLNFWETFENEVHNRQDLSGAQKFNYLRGQLKGEALGHLEGLNSSSNSYDEAIDILQEEYFKPLLIRKHHLKELFDLKCDNASSSELKKFKAKFTCHLRGLKALNENVDEASFVFTELLERKLPPKIRENMERGKTEYDWSIEEFTASLNREIELSENEKQKEPKPLTESKPQLATASNFAITAKPKFLKCRLCYENHRAVDCTKYSSAEERIKRCVETNKCQNCFQQNHEAKDCTSKFRCQQCNEKHHSSLCTTGIKKAEVYSSTHSILFSLNQRKNFGTALPTAQFDIDGTKLRAFFDQGSQETLIRKSFADSLGLKITGTEQIKLDGFSSRGSLQNYSIVEVPIRLGDTKAIIQALAVNDLPESIHMKGISVVHTELKSKGIKLADEEINNDLVGDIQMIVGANHYYDFVERQCTQGNVNLLISKLGVMVSGKIPHTLLDDDHVNRNSSNYFVLERKISDLWSLDTIGIKTDEAKPESA